MNINTDEIAAETSRLHEGGLLKLPLITILVRTDGSLNFSATVKGTNWDLATSPTLEGLEAACRKVIAEKPQPAEAA